MKASLLNSKLVMAALLALTLSSACGSKQSGEENTSNHNTTDSSSKQTEANHATEPKEPAGTSYPGSTDSASTSTQTPPAQK